MIDQAQILAALKAAKPRALRVSVAGRDDAVLVAISSKRDRWRRAQDTLDQMEWTSVEMLGEGDAILGIISDDDTGAEDDIALAANATVEERIGTLIIQAQRLALENNAAMLNPLIDGYVNLTNMVMNRLAVMEGNYNKILQSAYDNALNMAQLEAQANDDGLGVAGELLGQVLNQKKVVGKPAVKGRLKGETE